MKLSIFVLLVCLTWNAHGAMNVCFECKENDDPVNCGAIVNNVQSIKKVLCNGLCVTYRNIFYGNKLWRACQTQVTLPKGTREDGACLQDLLGQTFSLCGSSLCNERMGCSYPTASTYGFPSISTTIGPLFTTSNSGPAFTTNNGPAFTTSRGPAFTTNNGPAFTTSRGPAFTTNSGPAFTTSRGPAFTTNSGPAFTTSRGPAFTTNSGPAFTTSSGPVSTTTLSAKRKFINEALEAHNKYRALHGVPPLKINEDLCVIAQQYADTLAKNQEFKHSGAKFNNEWMGENLAWASGYASYTGDMPTDSWYNEIKDHDYTQQFQSGTGHFSQVIWKSTTDVCFGLAQDANGAYYAVGNYYPGGNMNGQFQQNVFPPLK